MGAKRGGKKEQSTGDLIYGIWLTLVVLLVIVIVAYGLSH